MTEELIAWRTRTGLTQEGAASLFGVNQPAVAKWEAGKVPALRALTVHGVTGIPLHVLRPDIYPAPKQRNRQSA